VKCRIQPNKLPQDSSKKFQTHTHKIDTYPSHDGCNVNYLEEEFHTSTQAIHIISVKGNIQATGSNKAISRPLVVVISISKKK
jgi:hypothetical protein